MRIRIRIEIRKRIMMRSQVRVGGVRLGDARAFGAPTPHVPKTYDHYVGSVRSRD